MVGRGLEAAAMLTPRFINKRRSVTFALCFVCVSLALCCVIRFCKARNYSCVAVRQAGNVCQNAFASSTFTNSR